MSYTIRIDNKLKLIRYKHSGNLSFEDIGMAWKEFLSIEEFTQHGYNLLSDYSKARFNMELEAVDDIVNFLKNVKNIIQGKKQSIIISDPYSTAGTMLFTQEAFNEIGFIVKIFATEEAAIKWLTKK